MLLDRSSRLWEYLTPELQGLIDDGDILLDSIMSRDERGAISDFSYLVFSYAKAYEGFLKKLFFDMGLISYDDYFGDDIRIGRILNPNYPHGRGNIFDKFCSHIKDRALPREMWALWHKGRNRVFHYFPRNFRKLDYEEAVDIAKQLVTIMERAIDSYDGLSTKATKKNPKS